MEKEPIQSTEINPVYKEIWEKARPYYEKGRPMDIDHIEWFMQVATEIAAAENLDDSILLPLAILHDVGYSMVEDVATTNYYQGNIRALHMVEGAKIARQILEGLQYDPKKIETIVHDISVHDNWAFDGIDGQDGVTLYLKDPILGTFKDLDYIWIFTEKGSKGIQPTLKKNDVQMIEHLRNEPSPIYGKKPFSNNSTKNLHAKLLAEREQEFAKKN